MSFVVSCQCGKQFTVADEKKGETARCPGCGTTLRLVPAGAAVAAPGPPPAEESDPFASFDLEAAAAMEGDAAVDQGQGARLAPPPPPLPAPAFGGRPAPATLGYAPPLPADAVDLREVAVRQKGVIYCLLAYITLLIASFFVPPELKLVVGLVGMAASITASVFVFMLAIHLYGTGSGVVLGILTLIPCVGLIVLLIVNGKATGILKQNGIHVGLLGANTSQIPSPGQFRR